MNRLKELTSTFDAIDRISASILENVNEVLTNPDYSEALSEESGKSVEECLDTLRNLTHSLTTDSTVVQEQLSVFVDNIQSGIKDDENCTFFNELWNGESYKEEGLEACKRFLKELNEQLAISEPDRIVKNAFKILRN